MKKKILSILVLLIVSGILISSVNAADLQSVDFGDFKLDVPGDNWKYNNIGHDGSSNGNGVKVAYFTSDNLKGLHVDSFQSFFEDLNNSDYELIESEGNISLYQEDGNYLAVVSDDDELYIIEDENSLEEAKAIAESAELKPSTGTQDDTTNEENDTQETTSSNSNPFDDYFTIDTPKGAAFEKDDFYVKINSSNVEEVYIDNQSDLQILYAESDNLDEYKDYFTTVAKNHENDIKTDGNLTIIHDKNTNETRVYLFSEDKIVGLGSFTLDADTLKDMANSVKFKK